MAQRSKRPAGFDLLRGPWLWMLASLLLTLPAAAQVNQIYSPQVVMINGDCEAELRPTQSVISGGVAASALKPSAAAEQLDKQMKLIREYVRQNHGTLRELERVRLVQTERSVNGQPRDPNFQLAQRIRAEFPVDAPMDSILEHLMELGMDRFGDNMTPAESRQSIVVVHYEIENFDDQLKQIRDRCTTEAWKKWCISTAGQSLACKIDDLHDSLQLQSLTLRSTEKLMRSEGSSDYYRVTITPYQSGQQNSPPELLGNVPLHLVGTIVLNCSFAEKK